MPGASDHTIMVMWKNPDGRVGAWATGYREQLTDVEARAEGFDL